MSFWTLSGYRTILEEETDYDSPFSEETAEQIRENIEHIYMIMVDSGVSGTLTSDPPNDVTGVVTDSSKSFGTDVHNGRTILFSSGSAKGNKYTIDDTDSGTTLSCTGDNLYSDGIRSGDSYKILFDILTNADGHDHDGVNSKLVALGDSQVTEAKIATGAVTENKIGSLAVTEGKLAASAVAQGKLKTSTGSVSQLGPDWDNETLPGGEYGFYPQIKVSGDIGHAYIGREDITSTSYITNISIQNESLGSDYTYAQQRYVTSSGEIHWIFLLREIATGTIRSMWQAPDHPCMGNGGKPLLIQYPFNSIVWHNNKPYVKEYKTVEVIPGYSVSVPTDNLIEVEILVVQLGQDEVGRILLDTIVEEEDMPNRDPLESFDRIYEIEESKSPTWYDEPVTVGLPSQDGFGNPVSDWRFRPEGTILVPIKKSIPKPEKNNFYHAGVKQK